MDSHARFYTIMGVLIALIIGGIIALIVLASVNPPKRDIHEMDVVLLDKGRGRLKYQLMALGRYLPWLHRIVVIRQLHSSYHRHHLEDFEGDPISIPVVTIITHRTSLDEMLDNIYEIYPSLSDYFLFLGDYCIPWNFISKNSLFSLSGRYRMWNFMDHHLMSSKLGSLIEKTFPSMCIDGKKWKSFSDLHQYILVMSLANDLIHSPGMHHMIILTGCEYSDKYQLNSKIKQDQKWVTFLLSPHMEEGSEKACNAKITDILSNKFMD